MLGNCGQNVDGRGGKGSRACGVQVPSAFKCLRRSRVQGLEAFKCLRRSSAFGVQGFKGILVVKKIIG